MTGATAFFAASRLSSAAGSAEKFGWAKSGWLLCGDGPRAVAPVASMAWVTCVPRPPLAPVIRAMVEGMGFNQRKRKIFFFRETIYCPLIGLLYIDNEPSAISESLPSPNSTVYVLDDSEPLIPTTTPTRPRRSLVITCTVSPQSNFGCSLIGRIITEDQAITPVFCQPAASSRCHCRSR